MIDECHSGVDLAELMNDENRYYAWNFRNLIYGGKNTIEFRRGPGVDDEEGCTAWVELAVSFVQAAIKHGTIAALETYEKSVEGLSRFIRNATVPQLNNPQDMHQIFSGKTGAMMPKQVGILGAEELARLHKKMAEDGKKNLMLKKYLAAVRAE